jgi:hypothetical protein
MKISLDNFIERFFNLHESLKLTLRSIENFRNSREALDSYLTETFQDPQDPFEVLADLPVYKRFIELEPSLVKHTLKKLDDVIEIIYASYLLNFVAIFEDHMKSCIRVLFIENPQMLDPERSIPLGKLISKGQEEVIKEEVERCVQILDRKSVRDRLDFLNEKFGLDFFNTSGKELLQDITDIRNKLLHEVPGTGVSKFNCDVAFTICFGAGLWLLMQIYVVAPGLVEIKDEVFLKSTKAQASKILEDFPKLRDSKIRRQ